MEKVIRDNKVAVLISPGYGAGWYSWHGKKELIFHPEVVKLVEEDRRDEITEEFLGSLLNTDEYICDLGASELIIKWLSVGTAFEIDEYDGFESLRTVEMLPHIA